MSLDYAKVKKMNKNGGNYTQAMIACAQTSPLPQKKSGEGTSVHRLRP